MVIGSRKEYTWQDLAGEPSIRLYAGALEPGMSQYRSHVGLNLSWCSPRCIVHDVRNPMPLPDACVQSYQAEDVFEHLDYGQLPDVFAEIHRVLRPGGLFRLSMPDYRCDLLARRCLFDYDGNIRFDPDGGGCFRQDKVEEGGHLWFPRLETVLALFAASPFRARGNVKVLHGYREDGQPVLNPIDYSLGHVKRTPDHDPRVSEPRRPLSLVIDAYKLA